MKRGRILPANNSSCSSSNKSLMRTSNSATPNSCLNSSSNSSWPSSELLSPKRAGGCSNSSWRFGDRRKSCLDSATRPRKPGAFR